MYGTSESSASLEGKVSAKKPQEVSVDAFSMQMFR